MICGWQELLSILPAHLAGEADRLGRGTLQELRLRLGQQPELVLNDKTVRLSCKVTQEDLSFCVNTASGYSPWASATLAQGYLTAPGGHRIGLCGEAVGTDAGFHALKNIRSLCIRVAGDHPGIAARLRDVGGSILVIGRPGSGKTTLLRDLIRELSQKEHVAVVDQRAELFPSCFDPGPRTDILTGCAKERAVDMLLRTMSPDTIAMDEITRPEDCRALSDAAWCGVRLIATAHAADEAQLHRRKVYRPLLEAGIFDTLVILERDKTWHMGRL